jgi:ABC-2 type transport system ATP-binding protein
MNASRALKVTGVSKRFGDIRALDSVDLCLDRGEIVALLGPNGAGKTTLVSIIAGLLAADEGEVSVLGQDVRAHANVVRRNVGLASQDIAIYPSLSVRQNLRFFGRMNGGRVARRHLDERIDRVSCAMNLSGLLSRTSDELSGGEKRRLHTAIALIHEPRLLLLDEPTAGADVQTRIILLEVIRELAGNGTAVCYCTHYLNEVETMDARVVILDKGQVITDGSLRSVVGRSGGTILILEFEGVPPVISAPGVKVDGNRLRMSTTSPSTGLADLLRLLDGKAESLLSIEVLRPSLEGAYLELTGRRFDSTPSRGDIS